MNSPKLFGTICYLSVLNICIAFDPAVSYVHQHMNSLCIGTCCSDANALFCAVHTVATSHVTIEHLKCG